MKYTVEEARQIIAAWAKKRAFEPTEEDIKIFVDELTGRTSHSSFIFVTDEEINKAIEGNKDA